MQYLIAIALLIGFGGGFYVASGIGEVNLTQCELNTEKMLKAHEKETADRMRDAQTATSRAFSHLTGSLIKTQQHAEDLTDELKKHTTGRNCLSADARRVLNTAAAQQQRMPEDTGSADRAATTPATDSGERYSTDADIAAWAVTVKKLYEQCTGRIEAIAIWDAGLNGRK